MQRLVKAYSFGLLIAVTTACQQSVPVGMEGKSCSRVGESTSNDDGCCTCASDKTWQCTEQECSSGAGGSSANGTTPGTGASTGSVGTPGAGGGSGSGTPSDPNPIPQDPRLMGDGTSNRTGLGGHWWTYVDRSGRSKVEPHTGKSNPYDTWTYPAELAGSIGEGFGIENGAYRVRGYVGGEPAYNSEEEEDMDPYWDGFYAKRLLVVGSPNTVDYCEGDTCGEMTYPKAGIGFGLQNQNVPLGALAEDKVGIAFRMKLGPGHGLDDDGRPYPVYVELPMDLTDAPDPTLGDQFGTEYAGLGAPNLPLCTFVNSPGGMNGGVVGRSDKSCFRHLTTQENVDLDLTTEWQTFCLGWDAFGVPPFPPADMDFTVAEQRAHLIKVQFEAFMPKIYTTTTLFDFYVDDVWLLDQAKWDEVCANAVIPQNPWY